MGPAMKWVIGLLIISAFFTGIASFIGQIETNYELDLGDGWNNVSTAFEGVAEDEDFTNIDSAYQTAEGNWTIQEDSAAGLAGWALSWPGHIFKTFAGVFRTIFGLGSISQEMVSTTGDAIGLDDTSEGAALINIFITIGAMALLFIGLRAYIGRDI
mgnify:CR=1 FL=1